MADKSCLWEQFEKSYKIPKSSFKITDSWRDNEEWKGKDSREGRSSESGRTPQPLSLWDICWFWALAAHVEPTLYVHFVKPGELLTELEDLTHMAHYTLRKCGDSGPAQNENKILSRKFLKNTAQYPTISQDKDQSSRPTGKDLSWKSLMGQRWTRAGLNCYTRMTQWYFFLQGPYCT